MRNRQWPTAVLIAILTSGSLVACGSGPKPDGALKSFVGAWQDGKLTGQKLLDSHGVALSGDDAQKQLTALEGDLTARRPAIAVKGRPALNKKKTAAVANVTVAWPVVDGVTWTYASSVQLTLRNKKWYPVFTPQVVYPDLADGAKLTLRKSSPTRATILDGAGQPIVADRPVTIVGVEPRKINDQNALIGQLTSIFKEINADVDLTPLPGQIKSAKPDAFVTIATLRQDDFEKIKFSLTGIPGIVTKGTSVPLAPTKVFARALLGSTGEVTKEILDKNPGKYKAGDIVGLSGLQQRYEDQLRGTAGVAVMLGDKKLFEQGATAGKALATTLDPRVQNAADSALGGETRRSAIVAIQVGTGKIVAVANGTGNNGLNLAFTASVPPGSTFKTVSSLALLDAGKITADTPQDCPKTFTVGGRTFKNSGDESFGKVPFKTEFAKSCNNAFTQLAPQLGPTGLADTARTLGIGIPWDLGTDAFTGKVSANGDPTEQAAASFGQGTTVVSPIVMAGAAAAVARGQWKQPVLITDPAPAKPAADGPALKQNSLDQLRIMMREVVLDGTASSLKGIPGSPLYGKTGTAEFDSTDPTKTHSWFIGYKGDYAFAVFVENGGASTDTAVPLAGKFLQTLGA